MEGVLTMKGMVEVSTGEKKMKIPKYIEERLSTLSEKVGVPIEDLMEELDSLKEEFGNYKIAWAKLRGSYRRMSGTLYSPAITYTGVIFGDSGTIDFVDLMRKKAISMFNDPSRRDQAISEFYTTPDGIPLDRRKTVNFEDNPNYLQPLDPNEKSLHRELYGVCCKGREWNPSEATFFRLSFNDEKVEELESIGVPFRTLVTFRANKRKTKVAFLDLNASKSLKVDFQIVKSLDDALLEDCNEAIRNCPYKPIVLADIPTVYIMNQNNKGNTPIILEAFVADIGDNINENTGERTLILDDEDYWDEAGLLAFIPGDMELSFGIDSRVFLVGFIEKFSSNGDDEERYLFRAKGYLPIKEYLVPP